MSISTTQGVIMSKDLHNFSKIVVNIIRDNRTDNAQKAGRQLQFVLNKILKESYSEKEFTNFLNILLKKNIMTLIGSMKGRFVIIRKIHPNTIKPETSEHVLWFTESEVMIFQPKLYIVEDGFPDSLIKKKVFFATKVSKNKHYQVEKFENDLLIKIIPSTKKDKVAKPASTTIYGKHSHKRWNHKRKPQKIITCIKNN